jgi:hypothetical protein
MLEELAQRGVPRGAEVGVAAATRAASEERGDGLGDGPGAGHTGSRDGTLEVIPVDTSDDVPPPIPMREARQTARSMRRVIASAGLAALLGVTLLAVSALSGGGGAGSPEEAVQRLADAIEGEDPLAAIDVISPDEVRTLRASVDAARARAAEVELVESAGDPLAGVDLSVGPLELEVVPLAPGFAKVVVQGDIEGATVRDDFSPLVQEAGVDDARGSVTLAELSPADLQPFLVTVERDGSWYVSAAYTVLEYIREANELSPADLGSGRSAPLGADSPEDAARGVVEALAANDWESLFSLAPPDEIPVYDYRVPLGELLADAQLDFTIDELTATSELDGARATVTMSGSGAYTNTDNGRGGRWELSGECLRIPEDEYPYAFCLSERGLLPFSLFYDTPTGSPTVRIETVQRDGRWFVSPVGTALDHLDAWIAGFDERALRSLLGSPQQLPPDGSFDLGEEVTFTTEGYGLAYVYTFEGEAGQEIVGQSSGERPDELYSDFYAEIYGPDGALLEESDIFDPYDVATLPATGTYTLVATGFGVGEHSFTLWERDDAPQDVIDRLESYDFPDTSEQCTVDPNGAVTCTSEFVPAPSCVQGVDESACRATDIASGGATTPTTIVVAEP